jgi:hypothetical protein
VDYLFDINININNVKKKKKKTGTGFAAMGQYHKKMVAMEEGWVRDRLISHQRWVPWAHQRDTDRLFHFAALVMTAGSNAGGEVRDAGLHHPHQRDEANSGTPRPPHF